MWEHTEEAGKVNRKVGGKLLKIKEDSFLEEVVNSAKCHVT